MGSDITSLDSLALLTPASEDTHLLLTDANIDTHSCRIIEQKKIRERLYLNLVRFFFFEFRVFSSSETLLKCELAQLALAGLSSAALAMNSCVKHLANK